jgi:RecB family exonuclease
MSITPWSFSKIKAFEQCPKRFYHEKILKEFPFTETEATRYGTEFHLAAEEYIRDGKPLPERFSYAQDMLDALNKKPGIKKCEHEMGVTENLYPCAFKAPDVWFRGIADLLIIDESTGTAWVIDYKTGKNPRYADKGQLELMALAVFAHFPYTKEVKAGLVFVVCNTLVKDSYTVSDKARLWEKWLQKYEAIKTAAEKDVWNPKPSGLCRRHCPVTVCVHNGEH